MNKRLFIFFIGLTSLLFSACSTTTTQPSPTPQNTPEATPVVEDQKKKTVYEYTATKDQQVALDLISENATVETKDYGQSGQFVTSINGLAGDNANYWAFYINGKYAEKGASQEILKKGDTIKFVYEAVSATK